MNEGWYRLGMLLVLVAGFWEGVMAVVLRLFTDKGPGVMTAANYLPGPWCYVAAAAVVAAAFAVIALLDAGHRKVLAREKATAAR
ncbi:hypothetical protein LE181_30955 [Streptomyces sp. SCA3-4]|uniref:hypothetical protein n=1 Tax=Streptomyces sichuanensis TaxID=2871810 RepID=UPI001CE3640D|nr:hypothetical protein [Streptomyces sichuanensis]MCA6096567.1 hypothetical protein [Streptomyces sichuanensis]